MSRCPKNRPAVTINRREAALLGQSRLKQRIFDAAGQAKAAQLTGGDPRQKNRVRPALATAIYARFFFFSAQRFFIASDNRFLPAGVNPLRFGRTASLPGAALAALEPSPASRVMARSMRSRSLFSSARILARSNVALLYDTLLLTPPGLQNRA